MDLKSKRPLNIFTVNSFTTKPFTGNPAAVCLIEKEAELNEDEMRNIAMEMNLSETAFVKIKYEHNSAFLDWKNANVFYLRWFTPTVEVPLCGHATMATAHVIYNELGNVNTNIQFLTKSGTIDVYTCINDNRICMSMPINGCVVSKYEDFKDIISELVKPANVKEVSYSKTTKKLLVCLKDTFTRQDLESLKPSLGGLTAHHDGSVVRGVILTVRASADDPPVTMEQTLKYDFYSRYFAPWVGISEDPVTGSAHTVLVDYWYKKLKKSNFFARQCSPRGGDVFLKLTGDERVEVSGHAKTMLRCSFELS